MSLIPHSANLLWQRSLSPRRSHFNRSLNDVEERQRRYLKALLARNADTDFGRRYGFDRIKSVAEYQQAVPLSDYEDYLPYIGDIASGKPEVLTAEPVKLFQPTSGSASASKLIPYTDSLKREFQRAVDVWLASIFHDNPKVVRGGAYWCLTPPAQRPGKNGVKPVGFDDDREYLGSFGRWLFKRVSILPTSVNEEIDIDRFLNLTLAHLLARDDLALISVWSPTFLSQLLDRLDRERESVFRLLTNVLLPNSSITRRRMKEVESFFGNLSAGRGYTRLWPNLALISCWTDGPSQIYVKDIEHQFPDTEIQGKGLVATEGIVSIPWRKGFDPVLAVESHFFEFQNDNTGVISLGHQLEIGQNYSVIVTTGGGLYRYRLGDVVTITGHIGNAPTMRFVARDKVSDLCGEKLSEAHVERSIRHCLEANSIESSFRMLAPVDSGQGPLAYCLFLAIADLEPAKASKLLEMLEIELARNYHYALCRSLGQLGKVRLFLIDQNRDHIGVFNREMNRRGIKLGEIKMTSLDSHQGWDTVFEGHFIQG